MNRKDRRKQKQKNVGELPSGTQEEAYITENRAQAGQIITLCAMIAAYDLFDTPADAWEQMGDALQKVGAEYKAVALRHGIRAADQWLAQQTADSMGKYIRDQWPIPRAAKNDRERLAFDAQRDGINYSLRLFVLCARQFFDWARDTGKMQQLLEETRGNYQRFLDEAALGDSYGHALLDRKVREMTGGEEHIGTDYNKQPIFGKTLY